jgi:LETM1 and EF-hand domain-containing protein 1
LFKFYYQGTKQIWKDRAIVADLRKGIEDRQAKGGEGVQWIENSIITRHEADLRKLPLFLAILLILEEILPLVVIYAPSLLPSTCVLPSQSTKMRSEEERKRGLAIQELAKNDQIRVLVDRLASQSNQIEEQDSKGSNKAAISSVSSLSTYGPDVIGNVAKLFALSGWGGATMVSSRIEKHLGKLQSDDKMLRHAYDTRTSSSQWSKIGSSDWLWKACAQRGLRAFEADQQVMEQNLIAYLHLSVKNMTLAHQSLLPLALYDGTLRDLARLQGEADQEASKGLRRRTLEVVEEVKEAEKKKIGGGGESH